RQVRNDPGFRDLIQPKHHQRENQQQPVGADAGAERPPAAGAIHGGRRDRVGIFSSGVLGHRAVSGLGRHGDYSSPPPSSMILPPSSPISPNSPAWLRARWRLRSRSFWASAV